MPAQEPKNPTKFAAYTPSFRALGIPAGALTIAPLRSHAALKAHGCYDTAKSGDPSAAAQVARDLLGTPTLQRIADAFGPEVVFLPVQAQEASGPNALAVMLAHRAAQTSQGRVSDLVYQVNLAFHTGARAMERMRVRAVFAGPVIPGRRYVIVDDVTVMGSTLADLAGHVRINGGEVAGVLVYADASRDGIAAVPVANARKIEERFGDEVRRQFWVEPSALTSAEAGYVLNFRDAEALRARATKVGDERAARLRAKGLRD